MPVTVTDISAVFASLNAVKNLATAMIGIHDGQAIAAKVREINGVLMDTQAQVFAVNQERATLIEHVRELEEQIADFENWDTEKQRYELKSIAAGSLVYVVKAEMQGTEPPHYICAKCYQDRKKSILQLDPSSGPGRSLGKSPTYSCPNCKSTIIAR